MVSKTIVFNQELIKEFKSLITFLMFQKIKNQNHSEMCYETEDVYQECLIWLNEATIKYDPTRKGNMSFKGFARCYIESRLKNLRNKIVRKMKNQTYQASEVLGCTEVFEGTPDVDLHFLGQQSQPASGAFKTLISNLEDGQNYLDMMVDSKRMYDELTGDRKLVFAEYFIEGKTATTVIEDHPHLKMHSVRRHLKILDQMYRTLVVGDIKCLA